MAVDLEIRERFCIAPPVSTTGSRPCADTAARTRSTVASISVSWNRAEIAPGTTPSSTSPTTARTSGRVSISSCSTV
jgi:hypothetical protein